MKHHTRFAPQKALGRLETLKGRRYTYAEIASFMGVDRQKIRYQLNHPMAEVKTAMIDNWMDFFAANDMPIVIGDLFVTGITGQLAAPIGNVTLEAHGVSTPTPP